MPFLPGVTLVGGPRPGRVRPPWPGAASSTANGNNASGDIVGSYRDAAGAGHGFLATPAAVPEPGALPLLALGLLPLAPLARGGRPTA